MRTNVVIDDALMESAFKVSELRTKKDASRLDSVNRVIEK